MRVILQEALQRAIDGSLSRPYRATGYFELATQGGASLSLGCILSGFQPERIRVIDCPNSSCLRFFASPL